MNNRTKNTVLTIILCISVLGTLVSGGYLLYKEVIEPSLLRREQRETAVDEDIGETVYIDGRAVQAKYKELLDINGDFIGKLYCGIFPEEGLNIVQADTNEKYYRLGFYGKWAFCGTVFMDYENNPYMTDMNTILYGHNMKNGTMFGNLPQYRDLETYKKYPTITFNTIYGNNTYIICAFFMTDSLSYNGYRFPCYTINGDKNMLPAYGEELKKRSYFINPAVDIQEGDTLLTLSTCAYDFKSARYVLVARKLRIGESPKVDTSLAYSNTNIKFPDKYYSVTGRNNPYLKDERFFFAPPIEEETTSAVAETVRPKPVVPEENIRIVITQPSTELPTEKTTLPVSPPTTLPDETEPSSDIPLDEPENPDEKEPDEDTSESCVPEQPALPVQE